jgi:hypothetical protein
MSTKKQGQACGGAKQVGARFTLLLSLGEVIERRFRTFLLFFRFFSEGLQRQPP